MAALGDGPQYFAVDGNDDIGCAHLEQSASIMHSRRLDIDTVMLRTRSKIGRFFIGRSRAHEGNLFEPGMIEREYIDNVLQLKVVVDMRLMKDQLFGRDGKTIILSFVGHFQLAFKGFDLYKVWIHGTPSFTIPDVRLS